MRSSPKPAPGTFSTPMRDSAPMGTVEGARRDVDIQLQQDFIKCEGLVEVSNDVAAGPVVEHKITHSAACAAFGNGGMTYALASGF